MAKVVNPKKQKEIRAAQLEELKGGIFPGIYVTERRNSSFTVVERWEFENKEESEAKYRELLDSGIPSAFLDCYVKFTLNQSIQKSCESSKFKVCGVQFPLEEGITKKNVIDLINKVDGKFLDFLRVDGEFSSAIFAINSCTYEDMLDDDVLSKFTQFVTEILNDVEKENKNHIYHFVYPASRRYRKITVFLDYSFI